MAKEQSANLGAFQNSSFSAFVLFHSCDVIPQWVANGANSWSNFPLQDIEEMDRNGAWSIATEKYTLCNTPSLHFSLNSQFGLFKRWGKTSPNLKYIQMVACVDTARTLKTTKQIQTRPSRLSEKTWLPSKQEIVKKITLFTPDPR